MDKKIIYARNTIVKEIAKIMNVKEGTIKTWLSRARNILKNKLEGGFENE